MASFLTGFIVIGIIVYFLTDKCSPVTLKESKIDLDMTNEMTEEGSTCEKDIDGSVNLTKMGLLGIDDSRIATDQSAVLTLKGAEMGDMMNQIKQTPSLKIMDEYQAHKINMSQEQLDKLASPKGGFKLPKKGIIKGAETPVFPEVTQLSNTDASMDRTFGDNIDDMMDAVKKSQLTNRSAATGSIDGMSVVEKHIESSQVSVDDSKPIDNTAFAIKSRKPIIKIEDAEQPQEVELKNVDSFSSSSDLEISV